MTDPVGGKKFRFAQRWADFAKLLGWDVLDPDEGEAVKILEQRDIDLEDWLKGNVHQVTFLFPGAVTDEELGPWVPTVPVLLREAYVSCMTAGTGTTTIDIDVNGSNEDSVTIGSSETTSSNAISIDVSPGDRVSVTASTVNSALRNLSVGLRWDG